MHAHPMRGYIVNRSHAGSGALLRRVLTTEGKTLTHAVHAHPMHAHPMRGYIVNRSHAGSGALLRRVLTQKVRL